MKKIYDKIWEILPMLWGLLWIAIITLGSCGVMLLVIKWFIKLVGAM